MPIYVVMQCNSVLVKFFVLCEHKSLGKCKTAGLKACAHSQSDFYPDTFTRPTDMKLNHLCIARSFSCEKFSNLQFSL